MLPYSTADVEVWPDEEEVAAQTSTAMHAVDSCNSSGEIDMAAAMQTIDTAARAAAIAHSQVGAVAGTTMLVVNSFFMQCPGICALRKALGATYWSEPARKEITKPFKYLRWEGAPSIAQVGHYKHYMHDCYLSGNASCLLEGPSRVAFLHKREVTFLLPIAKE